jgi:hypothetical protein
MCSGPCASDDTIGVVRRRLLHFRDVGLVFCPILSFYGFLYKSRESPSQPSLVYSEVPEKMLISSRT